MTISLPLDHDNYWYGVLTMDIPVSSLQRFLRDAAEKDIEGGISYMITISVCWQTQRRNNKPFNMLNGRERALWRMN